MGDVSYLVQFHRKDNGPYEEYEYWKLEDAQGHFDMFHDDDSGLYRHIDLKEHKPGQPTVLLQRIEF